MVYSSSRFLRSDKATDLIAMIKRTIFPVRKHNYRIVVQLVHPFSSNHRLSLVVSHFHDNQTVASIYPLDKMGGASVKAMYSASVVDKVTVGCKVAFQLTTDPPR
uniref:Uncharacterized protein n=1 Tax=Solanum lycopersicum TaxID=4081 RepID=A0A3Q7FRF3_SOLLC